ncbi:MAG TPA: GNAT family N-acetyltransferase [Terriglobales bacterium]|nr:GNAT family N-acetyltransferase [Terriglobales bacterium]
MLKIRPATTNDAALLKNLIEELAKFERLSHEVVITEDDLRRDGFGSQPKFRAMIAECDGEPAGYAFIYTTYSTFKGSTGIFLEDLFVRTQFRGKGIGKALLAEVARIARDEKCYGVRWEVLDWNQPAIDFYKSLGAEFRDPWKSVSLTGDSLKKLAEKTQ